MAIGCCENAFKYVLFFVNLLLLLAGLTVLGFSIYALVDSKSASSAIENGASIIAGGEDSGLNLSNLYTWVSITFIVVSSVIIIVSFLGCCGAWRENSCLLFSNFLLLLILLCATVGGAVMLYFQNLEIVRPSLVDSLKNYVPHPAEETSEDALTSAWDDVQKQFSCCGIDGYKDYTNISIFELPIYPDKDRNFVPASCCWGLDPSLMDDCRKRPNDAAYSLKTGGCFSELQITLQSNRDIVGIATLTIIAFLFANLVAVYTFTLCVIPNSGYEPVHRI